MSYHARTEEHLFHGFASGVGGYIERDFVKQPIPLAGGLALSVSGGVGSTCHNNYDFVYIDKNRERAADFRLQADKIFTVVTGAEREDGWLTTAQSELVNLDINGVVRADLVRAVTTSFHRRRANLDEPKAEAVISTKGSAFVNLTVRGVPVRVAPDETFERYATHEELRQFMASGSSEARAFRERNFLERSGRSDDYVCDMERFCSDTHVRCSIFQAIEFERECKDVTQHCYSLDIPDFGRLYIGEVLVSNGEKQLNMLRFDLGCDVCGGGTGGAAGVNGVTVP
jgi:hypothetical protein